MAKSWNAPASNWGNMATKKSYGRSSSVSTINTNWRSVPWATLYKMCEEEQVLAAATANEERKQMYDLFIDKKLAIYASMNPEAGAYEGNMSDEYPMGPVPDMFKIKRAASNTAIEEFINQYGIPSIALTILPQIIAHIATFKLTTSAGEDYDKVLAEEALKASTTEGLISAAALYRAYFCDDESMGLYNFLMLDSRSKYLETQYKAPSRNYCALVPLIMYAFKLTKGIPYTHWNKKQISGITNVKLADAMLYHSELDVFTPDEILEARANGLLTKSGPKLGQQRNPVFTYKLYGTGLLSHLPEYAQVMTAQIWCAHPENRTKYMVLDPANWDNIPKPLVSSEVLNAQTITFNSNSNTNSDSPWDL